MANANAVWGIDVGQCALKALRMEVAPDGSVEVTNFDIVEHPKILSQPDADRDQLVRNALDKFLSRNEIGNARVCIGVPGQSSFARFIKLPPVEAKRIPEIVKFEAVQQIPFDIEEVEWDYQTFSSDASPDVEVGIFAMRKELVFEFINRFREVGIEPDIVQLSPLALYNMMLFDNQVTAKGATILIDVGAENTVLVISDGDRIWMRSIPLGGNNFTESLVKAFKLPFSKAENLKRTAATSKYARQIFQAMRPVFGDLVSEVQRSIGFYTSLHRDAEIGKVICLGNAFRLPGLQKYLEQNLAVEAVRLNAFNRLRPSEAINAPAFQENVLSFAVAYGLGLQGLNQSPIQSNLLPLAIQKQVHWRKEKWWFIAAAVVMLLSVGGAILSARGVKSTTAADNTGEEFKQSSRVLADHRKIQDAKSKLEGQGADEVKEIENIIAVTGYRTVVLQIQHLVHKSFPRQWLKEYNQVLNGELGALPSEKSPEEVFEALQKPGVADRIPWVVLEEMSMQLFANRPPPVGSGGTSSGQSGQSGGDETSAEEAARPKWFRLTMEVVLNRPLREVPGIIDQQFLQQMLQNYTADAGRRPHERLYPGIHLDTRSITMENAVRVRPVAGESQQPAVGEDGRVDISQLPAGMVLDNGVPKFNFVRATVVVDVQVLPPGRSAPKADSSNQP